jgi:pre-mRNA-processing factor SLU7
MEKERLREMEVNELMKIDERKRPFNSMKADSGVAPTEEELEAYYRRKKRKDDPMEEFLK